MIHEEIAQPIAVADELGARAVQERAVNISKMSKKGQMRV